MTKKPLLNLRLKIELGIFGLCILGALAFIAAYYFCPTRREGLRFIGTALTASVGIYTAYHVAQTFDNNIKRKQEESAYQFLHQLNSADWVAIRDLLYKITDEKADHRNQYEAVIADKETRQKVMQALGVFEDIAIAISTGYADEDTIHRSIGVMIRRYYKGFYGYICETRTREQSPRLYKELEELNKRWENRSIKT